MESEGLHPELTERNYVLNCKLKFFNKTVNDHGRTYERKLVILVPQESDERTKFLTAWLPETQDQYFELVGYIGGRVDSPCRLSIHRGPDEKSEKHYLFVMSEGVEKILARLREGDIFRVEILPESAEDEADHAIEQGDGNYRVLE